MALIIFLIVIPLLLCVRGLWANHLWRSAQREAARRQEAEGPGQVAQRDPWPEEIEELIVAARLAGALDRLEYQEAMARLARADEVRSPLQVPRPGGE